MFKRYLLLVSVLTILFVACPLLNNGAHCLEENMRLDAELRLAEKPKSYFIFDIRNNKIFIKARGIVLREWEIEKLCFLGDPIPLKSLSLLKKNVEISSKRQDIKVDLKKYPNTDPNIKTDSSKIEALELDDMPDKYTLTIDGELFINVEADSSGSFTMFRSLRHSFRWYVINPILILWRSMKKKRFTVIDIRFRDIKDSKSLFWALPEDAEFIIY